MSAAVTQDRTDIDGGTAHGARMRIGVFAHRLAQRHATGIGRYLRELVLALDEVSVERAACVLASTPEPDPVTWIPRGVEKRVAPWPRRLTQAAWCIGAGPRLERAAGSMDVAHLIQPFPPVKTAAPQVVTVHDLFPFEHPDWYRRSERWTYRRSMALLLRRARRMAVPTAYIAQRLIEMLDVDPGRIAVVPQGVSGAFLHAGSPDHVSAICMRFGVEPQRFAVCVGAVSTRKNPIPLMRALPQLGDEALPLVMVGPDGHGAETVRAELASLRSRASVIQTGYLPDRDAAALVRGAALLVHPALGEGFGFVPLEAMAAGTPVIAAGVSSIPEVVGEAAVLVGEPTEPSAWAAALTEVMSSAERRAQLVAAGLERVNEFSWQRTAAQMLEVYRVAASA